MVAINIFHQPSFDAKLGSIASISQLCALLAAMMGYAARFTNLSEATASTRPVLHPQHFLDLAVKFINDALSECDDDRPPLCVLQALIIVTHCQLTRGVHGKAWRSLGVCVRMAYELDLHLIDADADMSSPCRDPQAWSQDEEKRRVWWAIWEMDVFASTIRRTPTAMDWRRMVVLLPAEDGAWFDLCPAQSEFLETDPMHRWKVLRESGCQSPKAWFIVINSLMKEAQLLILPGRRPRIDTRDGAPETQVEGELEIFANAIKCFSMALPDYLRFNGQFLDFTISDRQLHCNIYNIHLMTQLARTTIDQYGATHPSRSESGSSAEELSEPSDCVLAIINRSSENHIQHINTFLLNVIWLASAVQLCRRRNCTIPLEVTRSRFDVLYLVYKKCVEFWDAQTALQQNLEAIEIRLERQHRIHPSPRAQEEAPTMALTCREVGDMRYCSWIPLALQSPYKARDTTPALSASQAQSLESASPEWASFEQFQGQNFS